MLFNTNEELIAHLRSLAQEDLKKFNTKITPTKTEILGVKIPVLRQLAKAMARDAYKNLSIIGDRCFEEILLYGLVIGYAEITLDERVSLIREYVQIADNWAHVDCAVATYKFIAKHKRELLPFVRELLASSKVFAVRTGVVCLLDYYIEEEYLPEIFTVADSLNCKEYYISMAVAWMVSCCYVKYPTATDEYLRRSKMDSQTYNRTIQKICDSYRVDKPVKEYLKKTKRKL